MRKIHIVGLVLVAVLAFSAVGAASASAKGPKWIVVLCELVTAGTGLYLTKSASGKCEGLDNTPEGEFEKKLLVLAVPTEEQEFTSSGGAFTLDGELFGQAQNVECTSVQGKGKLIGGNPGTALVEIEFLGCHLAGLNNCLAGNLPVGATEDTIDTEARVVLVWPDPTGENDTEAFAAFFPDNTTTNNEFAKFTLKNASGSNECGFLFNGQTVTVESSGTEVTDVGEAGHTVLFDKKCGVLGLLGKLNGTGGFELTSSGEEVTPGALNFEGVHEAIILNANVSLIECLLTSNGGAADELGITDVTLVSGETFGWEL